MSHKIFEFSDYRDADDLVLDLGKEEFTSEQIRHIREIGDPSIPKDGEGCMGCPYHILEQDVFGHVKYSYCKLLHKDIVDCPINREDCKECKSHQTGRCLKAPYMKCLQCKEDAKDYETFKDKLGDRFGTEGELKRSFKLRFNCEGDENVINCPDESLYSDLSSYHVFPICRKADWVKKAHEN